MIVYDPFWKTLKKSSKTTYTLIKDHHISSSTIDKLRKKQADHHTDLERSVPDPRLQGGRDIGICPLAGRPMPLNQGNQKPLFYKAAFF